MVVAGAAQEPRSSPTPYADLGAKPYAFHGPRRDLVDPGDLSAVAIGLFAPDKGPGAAAGRSLGRGAELAIAAANQAGGLDGTPFQLITRAADEIWGSAREVVTLAYEDRVWAVIGGIGGQSTHIAQQVITKAQLPLISPASSDVSLTGINIPWMFCCMPDDEQMIRLLATHIWRDKRLTRLVAMAAGSYDSQHRLAEFEKQSPLLGKPLALSLTYAPGARDISAQLSLLASAEAQALVLFGTPEEAVQVLRGLRRHDLSPQIFAGPGLATAAFTELAGDLAEGITVVAPCDLSRADPILAAFRVRYRAAYSEPPDHLAAYAFDATQLVIAAIRAGGLNRARIRDALAGGVPYAGVTGEIRFDGTGSNTTPPVLAVIQDSHLISLDR